MRRPNHPRTPRKNGMNAFPLKASTAVLSLLVGAGCAHAPPKELADARTAYKQAADGMAARENPAQLHVAHNALGVAEQSFEQDGDSEHTRDLAYIALRTAQRAEVEANTMSNQKELARLEADKKQSDGRELKSLRTQVDVQQQQLSTSEAGRRESEQRATQMSADLARIATVKQEARGVVITLSGEVLFASGKAELLPAAQAKLNEVASALTQQNPSATIVVEGHTDRRGSEALNLDLSARRAEAVRTYLTAHGVPSERIRAEGFGFSRPLGDNKTAEGRANNRRVEIVVNRQGERPGG